MISDIDEETQDIDWFAVDVNLEIAHFTTAGRGFLPTSAKTSWDELRQIKAYFQTHLPPICQAIQSFNKAQNPGILLDDYLEMGTKGLHSFDCLENTKTQAGYYIVVRPSTPIRIDDMPLGVKELLVRTRCKYPFSNRDIIHESDFESNLV